MTDQQLLQVSVIDPVASAIEHVKKMLFKPFDLEKWFVIGFCAWLAYIGKRGGFPGMNFFQRQNTSMGVLRDFVITNLV